MKGEEKIEISPESALTETARAGTAATESGTKNLSIASLVLGIISMSSFSILTGIPAIVLGARALARKRPGRNMARAGIVLGVIGSLVFGTLNCGLFLTMARFPDTKASHVAVKNSMHVFQTAIEAYATDHKGCYPTADLSWWERGDGKGFAGYLPGGDPYGADGSPIPGRYPTNPYTRKPYKYGFDLFYFPTRLTQSGLVAITDSAQLDCPFNFGAPTKRPGTIVILGYTPEGEEHSGPAEYAIIGFGWDPTKPLTEHYATGTKVFYVLHN